MQIAQVFQEPRVEECKLCHCRPDYLSSIALQVEDIIDSGHTAKKLIEYLQSLGAKSVKIVTLLDKSERRSCQIKIDYLAFWVSIHLIFFLASPHFHATGKMDTLTWATIK